MASCTAFCTCAYKYIQYSLHPVTCDCDFVTPDVKSAHSSNWDQVEVIPSFLPDSLACVGKNSIWPFVEWQHQAARTQFDKSGKWLSHHARLNQVLVWTLPSFPLPCINYRLYSWQHHSFTVQWLWKHTLFDIHGHTQQDTHTVWQRLHRSDFLNSLLKLPFGLVCWVLLYLGLKVLIFM